ncbi:MAG: TonB family protein [Burkholderiales bacterium]|nr:TonB family protein [Burkholderiales bacterium]
MSLPPAIPTAPTQGAAPSPATAVAPPPGPAVQAPAATLPSALASAAPAAAPAAVPAPATPPGPAAETPVPAIAAPSAPPAAVPVRLASLSPTPPAAVPSRQRLVPLTREEPAFPREALSQGVSRGVVRVRLAIDASGKVSGVEVLAAEPRRVFDRAVVSALSRWTYAPGEPGRSSEVEVAFHRE